MITKWEGKALDIIGVRFVFWNWMSMVFCFQVMSVVRVASSRTDTFALLTKLAKIKHFVFTALDFIFCIHSILPIDTIAFARS